MSETSVSTSFVTEENLNKFKPLKCIISEAGRYAYCAICAVCLHKLFNEDSNKPFREHCLSRHISYVGLPKQVETVMYAFLNGESCHVDTLIDLLKSEVNGNCSKIIEDLVMFAVQDGLYDSRMRVLIFHVAEILGAAFSLVETYEASVVDMLSSDVHEISEEDREAATRRSRSRKVRRYLLVGAAAVGGGAILGLTGGLAAPFLAAGAGAVLGGAGAAALGSAAGVAAIGSLFGVAGAGLTGYKMRRRVGDIEEFELQALSEGRALHLTLAVAGWLTDENLGGFAEPWLSLMHSREQYCLRYESTYLLELGRAINYLFSMAASLATQEALKYTVLSGLIAAVTWPAALISVAGVIDNPWSVCIRRSAQVGRHLADVLMEGRQGRRPVTLIGFSLGARVVFYCLQAMAERRGSEGVVDEAILLGAPVSASASEWQSFSRVVAGRIVNGYCRSDWLLKFLYRTSSAKMRVAGLEPVPWADRRMCNIDLSSVVNGHSDYLGKMTVVLKAVGIRTRCYEDRHS